MIFKWLERLNTRHSNLVYGLFFIFVGILSNSSNTRLLCLFMWLSGPFQTKYSPTGQTFTTWKKKKKKNTFTTWIPDKSLLPIAILSHLSSLSANLSSHNLHLKFSFGSFLFPSQLLMCLKVSTFQLVCREIFPGGVKKLWNTRGGIDRWISQISRKVIKTTCYMTITYT